jgi:uncharacterized protein YfkK (UPF0435 family)
MLSILINLNEIKSKLNYINTSKFPFEPNMELNKEDLEEKMELLKRKDFLLQDLQSILDKEKSQNSIDIRNTNLTLVS